MRSNPLLRVLALLFSFVFVIAACGDDDDTDTSAGDADTSADDGGDAADGEAASADNADWPDKLVFGAVPAEESSALEENYDPIIELLEQELGVEIEFFQATDYAGIIEAQIAGNVDLAQYGPFSYVIAKTNGANIEPAGAMVDAEGEEPGYQSYAITRPDTGIESLADFAGKTVCFVDPGSTSGFLYPSAGLLDEGIDPNDDVTPVFAGGHDASGISVANGDCDAGFAFDEMVESILVDNGDIADGDLTTVWKSEVIAGSPLAVSLDLPADMVAEIQRIIVEHANEDYLLEVGICEGECKLTDEDVWGYAQVDDSFYDGVRAVCESTKAEACES